MHNKEKMQEAIYLISQLNRLQEDQETSPAMKRLIRAYIRSHLKAIHDEEAEDEADRGLYCNTNKTKREMDRHRG